MLWTDFWRGYISYIRQKYLFFFQSFLEEIVKKEAETAETEAVEAEAAENEIIGMESSGKHLFNTYMIGNI